MKVPLTVQEILIWHDTPQLFVAKDPIGVQDALHRVAQRLLQVHFV